MAATSEHISVFLTLASLFLISSAQSCLNHTFKSNMVFGSCSDLPHLGAHLHWNYIASTRKVEIAYRATETSKGWVVWATNPTGTGMVGSQALVAFHNAKGTVAVYPTPITSYSPPMLPGPLGFRVSNISVEYANNEMTIFAAFGPVGNEIAVNHVWQAGSSVSDNIPQIHSTSLPNLHPKGKVDFLST